MFRINNSFAIVAAATTVFTSAASAAPVIDGVFSTGEYAQSSSVTRDSFINGGDSTGGFQRTTRYLSSDASHLYFAVKADLNFVTTRTTNNNGTPADTSDDTVESINAYGARPGPFVNAYVYSSTGQNKVGGGTGTYGTADDLIVEGLALMQARDGTGGVWAQPLTGDNVLALLSSTGTANVYRNATYDVMVGMDDATGTYELSLPRTLVDADSYDTLRVGGQAWAYGLTFNSLTPVPEPTGLAVVALGAALLLRRGRRSRA